MSQEIVDAVRMLGREKGISEEKLMTALEDALLSAYKKQPGAARYARVIMDRDLGEFRVERDLNAGDRLHVVVRDPETHEVVTEGFIALEDSPTFKTIKDDGRPIAEVRTHIAEVTQDAY